MKPLILISNDDGIRAAGLLALANALSDLGEVVVVAPDRERSATSHAITLDAPLRATEGPPGWWAIDGTPADCVYLALLHLLDRRPALVVSGINHGYNLGSDFFYSGTVAAAVEAALRDLPAFAISLGGSSPDGFRSAASFAHALARAILEEGLPRKTVLNVNVPHPGPGATAPLGYRFTRPGERAYRDHVEVRTDLRGRRYFWIGGPALDGEEPPDSDLGAVRRGIVSVTPLDLDLTSQPLLAALPGWRLPGFEAILDEEFGR